MAFFGMGGISNLLDRLLHEKEIIIFGSGREAQNVYDFLIGNGIDISCFVSENYDEQSHRLFGKDILNSLEVRKKYKNPVFIECNGKHSSWGSAGTDYYDYIGFKRNENFFLIKDYIDIVGNNLENILIDKEIILIGDIELCIYLAEYFKQKNLLVLGYLSQVTEMDDTDQIQRITFDDMDRYENIIILIVLAEYYQSDQKHNQELRKKKIKNFLQENDWYDYTDYFSYTTSFIKIGELSNVKYTRNSLLTKKIILGSIESNSGNSFFRGLLDNHPNIMMMNYCDLNNNLFWICIRLSIYKSRQIIDVFSDICNSDAVCLGINDICRFKGKLRQLLQRDQRFTSQELFIIFHVAFMYANGKNILEADLKKIIIYWEPHYMTRVVVEDFVNWLGAKEMKCDIINVVRNIIMRSGVVKMMIRNDEDKRWACNAIMNYPPINKKENFWGERLIIKFEDLKIEPQNILLELCNHWGIKWSDTFMMTTCNGKGHIHEGEEYVISDFDQKPVYNLNEKYFSEFDRLRIMIINAPWQKKYGYPYVEISRFTRRELYEMFSKKFRFEDKIDFFSDRLKKDFKIQLNNLIRYNLFKVIMKEILSLSD